MSIKSASQKIAGNEKVECWYLQVFKFNQTFETQINADAVKYFFRKTSHNNYIIVEV